MRSPANLCRSGALFPQALDAPRAHELPHLLGVVGDLGIPFGAVDHLDLQEHGQLREVAGPHQFPQTLRLIRAHLIVAYHPLGDVY